MKDKLRVYAIFGVPPEIQAFGLAKFSRSADPLDVSIQQISDQKASKFLETFYFQYGHASIADLAHIAIAIENVSQIAALEITATPFFDGPWDGQESSTRYQDWSKRSFVLPQDVKDEFDRKVFCEAADLLFETYQYFQELFFELLKRKYSKPQEMKSADYERTLRARALDSARYLLFLGTKTSLGQIISYRTLEKQISRLLSSPIAEVRTVGRSLKEMCSSSAFWPAQKEARRIISELLSSGVDSSQASLLNQLSGFFDDISVAPTLVRYAESKAYLMRTYNELRQLAQDIFANERIWEDIPPVMLIGPKNPKEELLTTLLYRVTHYPYVQIRQKVRSLKPSQKEKIINLAFKYMGPHDEGIPELKFGYRFIFDILMDIGAMRDIHRHRRCVQIMQDFTTLHGFETPQYFNELLPQDQGRYIETLDLVGRTVNQLARPYPYAAQYLLPFAFRCRFLLKCDYEEIRYLTILRSGVKGNPSYRRVAWLMFKALWEKHPSLVRYLNGKVTSPGLEEPFVR